MHFHSTRAVTLALVVGGSCGCSVLFMPRPPANESLLGEAKPRCTASATAPVVDTAFALASLISTSVLLNMEGEVTGPIASAAGIGTAVTGTVSVISAIAGYRWARRCAEMQSQDESASAREFRPGE